VMYDHNAARLESCPIVIEEIEELTQEEMKHSRDYERWYSIQSLFSRKPHNTVSQRKSTNSDNGPMSEGLRCKARGLRRNI
jgi:hypothetical protein